MKNLYYIGYFIPWLTLVHFLSQLDRSNKQWTLLVRITKNISYSNEQTVIGGGVKAKKEEFESLMDLSWKLMLKRFITKLFELRSLNFLLNVEEWVDKSVFLIAQLYLWKIDLRQDSFKHNQPWFFNVQC